MLIFLTSVSGVFFKPNNVVLSHINIEHLIVIKFRIVFSDGFLDANESVRTVSCYCWLVWSEYDFLLKDSFLLILRLLFFHTTLFLYWLYSILSPTFILIYCFFFVSHSYALALFIAIALGFWLHWQASSYYCEKGKNREKTERDFVDSVPWWICQMCFITRQVSMADRAGALRCLAL